MAVIERTKNATRNIIFGTILKAYQILVPFLMRTAMIYLMGVQYLGLTSLFTSILQVLNLAELGVGSAMIYSMYKPIAEDDNKTICALMKLYRTYYRLIGLVVAVVEGVCNGIGSVISFLPTIVTLFLFLSIMEDSGYMARVAFVMDKLLRKIGLSGRSFVPMLIGFGCSVPAIMSTRTLSSERDRKMTILLTPFMSCSAKLPIYTLLIAAFFPRGYQAVVMLGLYLLGIICAIGYALVLQKTVFKGEPVPFVMELPNYRIPSAKSVVRLIWDKAKGFVQKAFTIIFVASVLIWFMENFDIRLNLAATPEDSLLALLGSVMDSQRGFQSQTDEYGCDGAPTHATGFVLW